MKYALFVLLCALAGCATSSSSRDIMVARVSALVDRTTARGEQQVAFAQLEALDSPAVPYLVSHLGDTRPLPEHEISLANTSPGAFEGLRHYSPETVHDALAAILNQLTGQDFVAVYNGASMHERQVNAAQWQAWCMKTFPEKATACSQR